MSDETTDIKCPFCGASGVRTTIRDLTMYPPKNRSALSWDCGSFQFDCEEPKQCANKCQVACLERDLADAQKLASWYALLARTGGKASVILCLDADAVVIQGETHYCTFDDNGLPLETPELRAALEKALDQPGGSP